MGIRDAGHAENGYPSEHYVVAPVVCPVPSRAPGAPKLSGACRLQIRRDSLLFRILGREQAAEQYFCNYELDPQYRERFEAAGLRVAAESENGEVRAVELPGKRFFLASLFLPQLSSEPAKPHPVIVAYLQAALRRE